jgi:hypothetical protein
VFPKPLFLALALAVVVLALSVEMDLLFPLVLWLEVVLVVLD